MRSVIPAALALSFATPHAGAGADIRSVTLSTAGLALLEAEAEMGAAPIELSIRRTDIDDFLKSFWLRDPAGSVPRLRLPGDGAFADVFAVLPLDPEDLSDQARLLDAMIGAPLAVERLGAVQRGRNMGVAERPCEDGTCLYLSLAQADGLTRHRLDAGAEVRFTEVDDRAMIARGLDAWRGQAGPGTIPVEVESAADTPRMVEMVWLQDAPTWRTAYRAIETEAGLQLQGWAVVENATGHDWQEVSLTLATGDVRALDVDLYTRKEVAREQAEAPRARGTADAAVGRTQTRGLALSPASAPAAQVEAEDGVSFSRYTLSEPVTLGAGEMVSLPFLDETLANARLLLHRGGQGRSHPRIALALENPLPLRLPGGVLTLYAAGRGHAGDAMIPEIPAEGEATVDVATDRAVTVRENRSRVEHVREMRVADGVLSVRTDLKRRTLYRVEGAADAARTLTLDHPRQSGWSLAAPEPTEERLDHWRFALEVPSGEIAELAVVERQPRTRGFALLDMDMKALARWSGSAPDATTRALLDELRALRREQSDISDRIERLSQRERALIDEQDRLVKLVTALGDESDATGRRRERVDEIDAEIVSTREERRRLRDELDALKQRIRDLVGA